MSLTLTIPPEIVSDILSRLPVKSLLRFRSTSKPVCSIIDGHDFAKLHLNQTNSKHSLVLANRHFPLFSVDLPSLERALEIDHPLKNPKPNTKLLGSCNGLLCLLNSDSESHILLFNMSTRTHHRLPHVHTIFPSHGDTVIYSHQVAYGLGYDSVHDDYKLVRIVRFRDTLDSEVRVYSLKSNSWKNVSSRFSCDLLGPRAMGLFANSALHWISVGLIVAFDLATEEFREVPLPPAAGSENSCELLWVFESDLGVFRNRIGKGAELWVLKPNESSWAKLLSISDPQLTYPRSVVPLAYLKDGNELLLLQDYDKLLRYDLKRNKVKNVRVHGLPASFDAMPYVESLVKPFPTVSATAGKHKSKKKAPKRDDFLAKGFKLVL